MKNERAMRLALDASDFKHLQFQFQCVTMGDACGRIKKKVSRYFAVVLIRDGNLCIKGQSVKTSRARVGKASQLVELWHFTQIEQSLARGLAHVLHLIRSYLDNTYQVKPPPLHMHYTISAFKVCK